MSANFRIQWAAAVPDNSSCHNVISILLNIAILRHVKLIGLHYKVESLTIMSDIAIMHPMMQRDWLQ